MTLTPQRQEHLQNLERRIARELELHRKPGDRVELDLTGTPEVYAAENDNGVYDAVHAYCTREGLECWMEPGGRGELTTLCIRSRGRYV